LDGLGTAARLVRLCARTKEAARLCARGKRLRVGRNEAERPRDGMQRL
jgi:hypothetical protein